ncbi:hypothetical protein [Thermofilum sp.]|uniref:hypothetical protein n=1 Tax=Thermofilum sp. TaxID=1961369 RepID=UPI00316449FC
MSALRVGAGLAMVVVPKPVAASVRAQVRHGCFRRRIVPKVTDNDPHAEGKPILLCQPVEEAKDREGAVRLTNLVISITVEGSELSRDR